jgi:2'-5' RNA ligase
MPDRQSLRLFVALDLGAAVAAGVARAIASARLAAPQARWTVPDGAHLTLAFLGGVDQGRVPAIQAALAGATAGRGPLTLSVGGAGTFGKAAFPRVLWLGVTGELRALASLQRTVTAALTPLGFPAEDRPFHPHLTLARARDERGDRSLARAADRLATFEAGQARVDQVSLMQSHLGRGGAHYEVVWSAPLAG